jgi:hypothetical protein
MKKGAEDFIEKPFQEDELVRLVEKMLERARVDFSKHQEAASRDALLSRLTTREAQVLERIVAGPAQQADRRRPGHQHQDGRGAPRQHHGKTERQHRRRPPQDRAGRALESLTAARLIDGAGIARRIRDDLKTRAAELAAAGHPPALAVVLVGDDPASAVYVRNKIKACAEAGIRSILDRHDATSRKATCSPASRPSTTTLRCTASWSSCRFRAMSRRSG